MKGSIACKWWDNTMCDTGKYTTWIDPGKKDKLKFIPKAFACRLPLAGYSVQPVPLQ